MNDPDEALRQALRSYAGVTSGDALDAELLRARILRSARAPQRRSLRRYSLVLPLVATLAASIAFAASQPYVRAAVATRVEAWFSATAKPAPKQARRAAAPRAPSAPVASAPPDANGGPPAPIAIDELPLAALPTPDGAHLAAPLAADSDAGAVDPQLEAYRAAHRTHFDSANPSAALAAWDRYLADFPAGSFASDARFNRALCLVRLGRRNEARAALAEFAEATPGSYRQAEASALLQGLAGRRHAPGRNESVDD